MSENKIDSKHPDYEEINAHSADSKILMLRRKTGLPQGKREMPQNSTLRLSCPSALF